MRDSGQHAGGVSFRRQEPPRPKSTSYLIIAACLLATVIMLLVLWDRWENRQQAAPNEKKPVSILKETPPAKPDADTDAATEGSDAEGEKTD